MMLPHAIAADTLTRDGALAGDKQRHITEGGDDGKGAQANEGQSGEQEVAPRGRNSVAEYKRRDIANLI